MTLPTRHLRGDTRLRLSESTLQVVAEAKMLGAAVGAAEHCELAAGTSANTTLPPDQPQQPGSSPSAQHPCPGLAALSGVGGASSEECH